MHLRHVARKLLWNRDHYVMAKGLLHWVLEQYRQVWEAKITDILTNDWKLKTLDQWPDIWPKMTSPGEVKDLKERSRDGEADSFGSLLW